MKWEELAQRVVGLGAPLLGAALAGPFGAAAGKILAQALDAPPMPAAVEEVLRKAQDHAAAEAQAAAAVRAAEAQWLAALAEVGKAQVAEVGATQRAEMASGAWLQRCWRPLYALELSLIECPAFATTLLHALWTGHEPGINGFAVLSSLLIAYFGARFGVLGIYVGGRTREKQAMATGETVPSLLGELLRTLKR